jgi:glutamate dehydrogenase/leucine dehydrogenase
VAQLLAEAGAKLVAISTVEGAIVAGTGLDVARLLSLKQQYGDKLVHYYSDLRPTASSSLFFQPVDLLVPGARPGVIHADNASQIQAGLIVPISNAPITPEAERILLARDIAVIPDFVANCGGILASSELSAGFDLADVRRVIEKTFAQVVFGLLAAAQREERPVGEIARTLAWQNHQALNEPRAIPTSKLDRLAETVKNQGVKGLSRRLAWRVHRRWPHTSDAVHRAAADRFTEWGLGLTLQRVTSLQVKNSEG